MKIVFFIGSLANSGGMERILSFQANYFADTFGYDITIFTYEQAENTTDFFQLSNKITRIKEIIKKETYSNKIKNLLAFSQFLKKLKRKVKSLLLKGNFDIALSFGVEGRFLHSIKDNSKKIAEFHFSKDFYNRQTNNKFKRVWRKYRFLKSISKTSKYSKIVVLTDTDKKFWDQYLPNVIAINNPLTFETNSKSDLKNKIAVALGRLTSQKGFDRLITIWNKANSINSDWKLHIYGEGSEKENLVTRIEELRLHETVKIFEPVKDVEKVYQNASLYLMTSRFEGFGLVLIEAMSNGLPVISYNVIGPNELVLNDCNGYLIDNGNEKDFVDKLIMLQNSFEKRKELGKNALDFVTKFSPEVIMKQWKDLFEEVLKS